MYYGYPVRMLLQNTSKKILQADTIHDPMDRPRVSWLDNILNFRFSHLEIQQESLKMVVSDRTL